MCERCSEHELVGSGHVTNFEVATVANDGTFTNEFICECCEFGELRVVGTVRMY